MSGSSILANLKKRADLGAILIAIVLFVLYAVVNPGTFFTWFSINDIIQFSAILAFVAIGQTLLLIAREIDLSVGSVYGLTGIGLILLERYVSVVTAVVLVLLGAAAIGLLNGFLVLRGRLSSMIVTLMRPLLLPRPDLPLVRRLDSLARPAARTNWLIEIFGGHWLGMGISHAEAIRTTMPMPPIWANSPQRWLWVHHR
jgi:ribose/xylose/arabinose/galactoside ABC-type transport system permease subunit